MATENSALDNRQTTCHWRASAKENVPVVLLVVGVALAVIGLIVMTLGFFPGVGAGVIGVSIGSGATALGLTLSLVCLTIVFLKKCIQRASSSRDTVTLDTVTLQEKNIVVAGKKIVSWKPLSASDTIQLDSTTSVLPKAFRPCGYFVAADGSQALVLATQRFPATGSVIQYCRSITACNTLDANTLPTGHNILEYHAYNAVIVKDEHVNTCRQFDMWIGPWKESSAVES